MAAYVCKSKNKQFSMDINNIFLLVSLDEGMDQGFTCMRNVCYRRKARVLLKKVFAYPFLYLNAFIPISDQMACHFSNQSNKTKKPFPLFNLRYLWLIFWQPKMYYSNISMTLIMITLMFVLVTFNGHSWAKQTIKTQLIVIDCL